MNIENIAENKKFILHELDELLKNRASAASRIRGFRHDNGFTKLYILDRTNDRPGLRVHFWDECALDGNVHNHRWDMYSWILKGEIGTCSYKEQNSKEQYEKWLYSPNSLEEYQMQYLGSFGLKTLHKVCFELGDSYTLRKNELHRISNVSEGGAITVILSSNESDGDVHVYTQDKLYSNKSFNRELAPAEINNKLLELKDAFAKLKSKA